MSEPAGASALRFGGIAVYLKARWIHLSENRIATPCIEHVWKVLPSYAGTRRTVQGAYQELSPGAVPLVPPTAATPSLCRVTTSE